MIRFVASTNPNFLLIEVQTGLESKPEMLFSFQCAGPVEAELLRAHLAKKLDTRVREMRLGEYRSGWKDAKSKKAAKRDWAPGVMERRYTEVDP